MVEPPRWKRLQKERPIFIHYRIQKLAWEPQIDIPNQRPSGPASRASATDSFSCHVLPPAQGFGLNICQPLGYFLRRLIGRWGIRQQAGWSFKRTCAVPHKDPCERGSEALGVGGQGGKSQGKRSEAGMPSGWKDPSKTRGCTRQDRPVSVPSCTWPRTITAGLRSRAPPVLPHQLLASASRTQLFLPSSEKPSSPTSSGLHCCLLPPLESKSS